MLYVKGGPELSVLLSAHLERPTDDGGSQEMDVQDSFRSTDVAVYLGTGFEKALGSVRAFADVGYSHGLTDVYHPSAESPDLQFDIHNQTIRFALGFWFR